MNDDVKIWGGFALVVAAFVGLIFWAAESGDREVAQYCATVMTATRTSHDTLEALIACRQAHDAFNTRIAISAGAGAIAGSAAARR